jgi:hypothetical protein
MGITDDGGADQDEDAGADDRADAERRQIPGRKGLLQPMIRVIRVLENLVDGFRSKEPPDHRPTSIRWDAKRRIAKYSARLTNPKLEFFFNILLCGPATGGAQKGLEQSPVERMLLEQKFRMPLDAEKETVGRGFDRLDDAIGSYGAGDQ